MKRHEYIRAWREETGIPLGVVARAAGLEERVLQAIEVGAAPLSIDQLESLARVLGFRADDLLEEEVPQLGPPLLDPLRCMLKSAEDFQPTSEVRLRMLDAGRAALDLLDFRAELSVPAPEILSKLHPRPLASRKNEPAFVAGADLAKELRRLLGISGPIPSVRDLLSDDFAIPIVAANLSQFGPDAFTVYRPDRRAAMVLNLDGKNTNALVRRFALLHELCHALFDRPAQGPFGVACRVSPDLHHETEQRANAFAIRFLFPEADLTAVGEAIFTRKTFRAEMEKWGVSAQALALHVKNTFRLGNEDARSRIPSSSVEPAPPSWVREAEELPAEQEDRWGIPMSRRGALAREVAHALVAGKIGRSRARALLRIDALADLDEFLAYLDLGEVQG